MSVVILDFGSQYTRLIARRVRELAAYSVILPGSASLERILKENPSLLVLSGGPRSVFETDAPRPDERVYEAGIPVLGICYGKTRTSYLRGYLKVVGQNFWYLISQDENLYIDIIEPIGYRAKEHNEAFHEEKARVVNRFTKEFIEQFCNHTGAIEWAQLVEFASGNLDLPQILS